MASVNFTSSIHADNSGNVTHFTNTEDVVSYTNFRSFENFTELKKKYNGLHDIAAVDQLLKNQQYIEVLNHLWSEQNQEVRISWLQSKLDERHPILLCELAIEYIEKDPSIPTYLFHSQPLLDTALCLTEIDASCTSDASVSAASGFLSYQYGNLIAEKLLPHHTRESILSYMKEHFTEYKNNKNKMLRDALNRFINPKDLSSIPSPEWVFGHGLGAFNGSMDQARYSESQWPDIRKNQALECLELIDEDEELFQENPQKYIQETFEVNEDDFEIIDKM